MAKPELNKTYICSHSYTHPNMGHMLTKGNKYTCKEIDADKNIIAMSGRHGGVNCGLKFFEEHFVEPVKAEKRHTLKLTAAEAKWLKNFFAEHIDEIADIDGGVDYKSLLLVSDKIEKL